MKMRKRSAQEGSALFTDLYEIAMAQAYDAWGMQELAVFELIFRTLPRHRNFMMVAGISDVIDGLESWRFGDRDIDYLASQGFSSKAFIKRLSHLRFTGDLFAMPEGTIAFPNEPIVQIVAPLIEAQLVETFILNQVHLQSLIATKAVRIVQAARGRQVVDFGSRRAHGTDAAIKAARAGYLAGLHGTSNLEAGRRYGIPVFGTMAHSFIQAHDDELTAFERFAAGAPTTTLLVDTFETLRGVQQVIELRRKLGKRFQVRAIRLDSGDFGTLSKAARRMLDDAGLSKVQIFVSSGLDEYAIEALLREGAPIDGFGVGTKLVTSSDAPWCDMAYKLVEYAGKPRIKLSSHKRLYPGRKQVFRFERRGRMLKDLLCLADERPGGRPLLVQLMRAGKQLAGREASLQRMRMHAAREVGRLPTALHGMTKSKRRYPVEVSRLLKRELKSCSQFSTHRKK